MMTKPHPFKPGDWVVDDRERVAKVKQVHWWDDEALLDLWIYEDSGHRVGRESPALGGPKTYEPMCSCEFWHRLEGEPEWPVQVKWVDQDDGTVAMKKFAGPRASGPANYAPRPRKPRYAGRILDNRNELRKALEAIADGHNDARRLARETLGRKD